MRPSPIVLHDQTINVVLKYSGRSRIEIINILVYTNLTVTKIGDDNYRLTYIIPDNATMIQLSMVADSLSMYAECKVLLSFNDSHSILLVIE